jgi:hypothetical protein
MGRFWPEHMRVFRSQHHPQPGHMLKQHTNRFNTGGHQWLTVTVERLQSAEPGARKR